MRYLLLIALLTVAHVARADETAVAPDPKAAVERGLAFLAQDSLAWKESKKCASCHHAPMTLWTLHEAKTAGYKVDEKAIAELSAWSVAKDDPARLLPKRPADAPKQTRQPLFRMAVGLGTGDTSDPAVKQWLVSAGTSLAEDQSEDGAWRVGEGRQPMVAAEEVTTVAVLLALNVPAVAESPEAAAAREKGLKWYLSQPVGDDAQALALRLILYKRLARPESEWQPLIKSIRERQKPDGGWSQTPEMASDAYATGQALYALAEAGVKSDDEAVRKGQAFLAGSQRPDGSWPMVSRPMKPGGAGAGNISPITHAGSAWGVLGLVRTLLR